LWWSVCAGLVFSLLSFCPLKNTAFMLYTILPLPLPFSD
jgi:hypothetical protein